MNQETNGIMDRNGWCRIQTSTDFMEAYLIIEPPLGSGKWPTRRDALEVLRSEGITTGILEEVLNEAIDNQVRQPVLVAKGEPAVNGVDADIHLLFEIGVFRKASVQDETGRIDFRNVQTVQNVEAGAVIGEKTPATKGQNGRDIKGREIQATPGRDKYIKLGKNVSWSSDELKLIAGINGEPTFFNNKVNVLDVHEIKGDVNFKTGNIIFSGNVVIRGNVESGFKVEAEGDVTIYGIVEAADIKAGGNLFVQGGISGMDKSQIFCGGDFSAKYIEHAVVICEGNLTAREAIMHCQLNVDGKIRVEGGKGLLVGGTIRCGEEISAKTIGSRLGTVTEIEVGVKPKLKLEYQELDNQIKQNKENMDKSEKAIALLNKIPNLPLDRQENLQSLIKTVYTLKGWITEAETRRQQIMEEILVRSKQGRVKVLDIIYPGTRVVIGRATLIVPDEIKYSILVYSEGEVQFQSFR